MTIAVRQVVDFFDRSMSPKMWSPM